MKRHYLGWSRSWVAAACMASTLLSASAARAQDLNQILKGFEIAPVSLNLKGKNWALVGYGSYLVNTTGCNDCHTYPNWATDGNPYLGRPEQINTAGYMAGGRPFGVGPDGNPIVSANITPNKAGKPAGLTQKEFLNVMHTGNDPDVPGRLLQVMPWPLYRWKSELDLTAMYEYLRAIPFRPNAGP